MKSFNKNEKHMIEMLKKMPHVKDKRDKNELFQRISSQMNTEKQPKSNKKVTLIPIFSTLFAIAILLVIIPTVINNDMLQTKEEQHLNNASDSAALEESAENSQQSTIEMDEQEDASLSEEGKADISLFGATTDNLVLNNADGQTIIYAAAADQQGQYVVPLSFVVPKTEDRSSYYNRLESYFKESEWGVGGYLFKDVFFKINEGNQQVTMNIPEEFSIGQGATSAAMFEKILSAMFGPMQIDKAVFETPNNQGVNLGPIGTKDEIAIKPIGKSSYKLYQVSEESRQFLVPVPQEDKINDALNSMKQSEKPFNVSQTIPNDVKFNVEKTDDLLTLTFADGNTLADSLVSNQEKITMVDAILMTAKSFGYDSVQFNNAGIEQIGRYNLTKSVNVPLAVNPIRIDP